VSCFVLYGRKSGDDLDPVRGCEDEVRILCRNVLFQGTEAELGDGAILLLDLQAHDRAGLGYNRDRERLYTVLHALWHSSEYGAVAGGGHAEVVELFFEVGVAQKKSQWAAHVVQLLGRNLLGLGVAWRVEVGVLSIQNEQLAFGSGVAPAHLARFPQQQGAAFGPVHPHTGISLGVLRFQRTKPVVVVIHAFSDVMQRLRKGRNGKEKNKTCEATNHSFYDARRRAKFPLDI